MISLLVIAAEMMNIVESKEDEKWIPYVVVGMELVTFIIGVQLGKAFA